MTNPPTTGGAYHRQPTGPAEPPAWTDAITVALSAFRARRGFGAYRSETRIVTKVEEDPPLEGVAGGGDHRPATPSKGAPGAPPTSELPLRLGIRFGWACGIRMRIHAHGRW
jgi:hypothetical protein